MATWHYTFVQPTECTAPQVNLHVNYGLWVIIACQHRFVHCNKCPTLVQDDGAGKGGAVHV